jgi:hypothetical protein
VAELLLPGTGGGGTVEYQREGVVVEENEVGGEGNV